MFGAHVLSEKKRTEDISIETTTDFESLLLSPNVIKGLRDAGFVQPSPIQLQSIPYAKCGVDLICQAKSGTGKTCVFAVCALEVVDVKIWAIQVLVLAPTREIAHQIHGVFTTIGSAVHGLKCCLIIGGIPIEQDLKNLKTCHIAIGTPGRIKHHIEERNLPTEAIRLFVLDEADKLLEEGSFQKQINWIYSTLPKDKQVLALSATYPESLASHLSNYMQEPVHVRINVGDLTLKGVNQYVTKTMFHPYPVKAFEEKVQRLKEIIKNIPFQQCMVFSNFQSRAENLSKTLCMGGWPCTFIAGGQIQTARIRAMDQLKNYNCRILITTDLTARGIDCDKVDLVINLDLPWETETYLHRVGRAGRFGSFGVVISIVSEGEEFKKIQNISAEIGKEIPLLPKEFTNLGHNGPGTFILEKKDQVSSDKKNVVVVNGHSIDNGVVPSESTTFQITNNDMEPVKQIDVITPKQHTDSQLALTYCIPQQELDLSSLLETRETIVNEKIEKHSVNAIPGHDVKLTNLNDKGITASQPASKKHPVEIQNSRGATGSPQDGLPKYLALSRRGKGKKTVEKTNETVDNTSVNTIPANAGKSTNEEEVKSKTKCKKTNIPNNGSDMNTAGKKSAVNSVDGYTPLGDAKRNPARFDPMSVNFSLLSLESHSEICNDNVLSEKETDSVIRKTKKEVIFCRERTETDETSESETDSASSESKSEDETKVNGSQFFSGDASETVSCSIPCFDSSRSSTEYEFDSQFTRNTDRQISGVVHDDRNESVNDLESVEKENDTVMNENSDNDEYCSKEESSDEFDYYSGSEESSCSDCSSGNSGNESDSENSSNTENSSDFENSDGSEECKHTLKSSEDSGWKSHDNENYRSRTWNDALFREHFYKAYRDHTDLIQRYWYSCQGSSSNKY